MFTVVQLRIALVTAKNDTVVGVITSAMTMMLGLDCAAVVVFVLGVVCS